MDGYVKPDWRGAAVDGGGVSGAWAPAALACVAVTGWALAGLFLGWGVFARPSPAAAYGLESASAIARLFGALVIFLFLPDRYGSRLAWVAAGILVLGMGGAAFGYVAPAILGDGFGPGEAAHAFLLVSVLAAALLVVALFPAEAPGFSAATLLALLVFFCATALAVGYAAARYGATGDGPAVGSLAAPTAGPHPALALLPLALSAVAAAGAARLAARGELPVWLSVATVVFAGSQLHNVFWPSTYGQVVTSADPLRLAFAAVVAWGAVSELGRASRERKALLAEAEDRSRLLAELTVLKADFTAMVAHELANPLRAVRGLSEMLALGDFCGAERARLLERLQAEADGLEALIEDVRTAAAAEREDFRVRPRPVRVGELVGRAASFARALPGAGPLAVYDEAAGASVMADPARTHQVLCNLLTNAAKYSPEGAPIRLAAVFSEGGGKVRLEVADRGAGIRSEDLPRLFEKFSRGRGAAGGGAGLGLYLSRRIVRGHGGEISVRSEPGGGSAFAFELARTETGGVAGDGHGEGG